MANNKLAPGRYMRTDAVKAFFSKYRSSQVKDLESLPLYIGEYSTYYSTADIKPLVEADFFRDMEVNVTTHLILSDNA